jgi:PiT family inorganic phosphate transporter
MVEMLVLVVVFAIIFDYINGFHDAANAIATTVSTGVLHIRTAVIVAAVFNFIGAMAGTAVAKTIATGFADPTIVTQYVVLSALIGACVWNLITWWLGLPSSSSHALIGGLAGAVVASTGLHSFNWVALYKKVVIPLMVSPTLGFIAAFIFMIICTWVFKPFKLSTGTYVSRKLQLLSSCVMAFSHGSNDAQKSMGIITLALLAAGSAVPHYLLPSQAGQVPTWVVVTCAAAIALGTMAGGKKIIKTMGSKIIKITPLQGFAAETAGAATILLASKFGIPVSTTHCINASIMGVGTSKRISAVRWGVAGNIVMAWVLTLPAAAGISYLVMTVFHMLGK